jgi:hypothetical protein
VRGAELPYGFHAYAEVKPEPYLLSDLHTKVQEVNK